MKTIDRDEVLTRLDEFDVEVPSWGFWRGGTRFETYVKEPRSIEERIEAAERVYRLTGKGKTVSLHFPWDGESKKDIENLKELLNSRGLEAGGVNANLFSMREDSPLDERLRFGSFISPFSEVREASVDHVKECVEWMRMLDSHALNLWLPDGSDYFGEISFYDMFERVAKGVEEVSKYMKEDEKLFLEYKPFEPAMYSTAMFDWGAAKAFSEIGGEDVSVLVDLGHHLKGANVEQIIAYLIKTGKFGGFHFNDSKSADDDLPTGSLNPHELFRIFCVLEEAYERNLVKEEEISFMVDQSCLRRDPTVATIETIENILIGYLKSLRVDFSELQDSRDSADFVRSQKIVRDAFNSDVREILREWRESKGLPEDPISAY